MSFRPKSRAFPLCGGVGMGLLSRNLRQLRQERHLYSITPGPIFPAYSRVNEHTSQDDHTPRDLDHEQARLAYSIIESLIEHTQIISDLVALMARTLDQDTTKALTLTPQWTAYLESRRAMERTRADVETFAEIMKKLGDD